MERSLDAATSTSTSMSTNTSEKDATVQRETMEEIVEEGRNLPLSIDAFLAPVATAEAKRLRVLSSLCARTYFLRTLTPASLRKRHRLELVTSSLACEYPRVLESSMAEQDKKTVLRLEEEAVGKDPRATNVLHGNEETQTNKGRKDAPGQKLSTGRTGTWTNIAAPLASAAIAGGSAAAATISTVMGAVSQSYFSREGKKEKKEKEKNMLPPCPVEWFVCDSEDERVRYLVIQGSDSLASWRSNLSFDPVLFEDSELGIRVHRGTYEAALVLYSRIMPIAKSFLQSNSRCKIQLTGHSLGGSIAMLLMLMMVLRGDVAPNRFLPVVTFGSAAIFCDGLCGCGSLENDKGSNCSMESGETSLLERLGFNQSAVQNIMMHRDIVPRAFSCDYALVAQLLQNVNQSFRDHSCLRAEKQVLYKPIGDTIVLQPMEGRRWSDHSLLPAGPGLYRLKPATTQSWMAAGIGTPGLQRSEDGRWYGMPLNVEEAHFALLNNPHPLQTLADAGAYGPEGSISLHHNPDHYTRAIGHVVKSRRMTFATFLGSVTQQVALSGMEWPRVDVFDRSLQSVVASISKVLAKSNQLHLEPLPKANFPLGGEHYSP